MCGILGYYGPRNGTPIVHEGLKALSYRGYDSWGLAIHQNDSIILQKEVGDITNAKPLDLQSNKVVGHTRWATHGGVTRTNAHPHKNKDGTITVVHNGIIENYQEIKIELEKQGYAFESQTDTEVIPHLIDSYVKRGCEFEKAFKKTINKLTGNYAIIVTSTITPEIYFARNGSPLVIGIGQQEYFISSDVPSFLQYTKTIMQLEDGDYGYINGTLNVYHDDETVERPVITTNWSVETARKGDYPHFMIKEINEQPLTIHKAINQEKQTIDHAIRLLRKASTVMLVGCGTSYNTCATATYQFRGKMTLAILGSEFQQYSNFIDENTLVIAVSQSGETADVIDAVKLSKQKNAKIISIVNTPTSTLARTADVHIPMNSGPELCVLSTKTCTSQLAILTLLANELSGKNTDNILKAANESKQIIKQDYSKLAKKLADKKSIFVLGRGALSQMAREAALKIKEVSYIHAEGMPAGELKHGSIALIEEGTPVIVLADDSTRELTTSNAMEVKARGAYVIGIDSKPNDAYDYHIQVPEVEGVMSILTILPVQLIAYHLALERGCDPDKPRNLAKSVTVR